MTTPAGARKIVPLKVPRTVIEAARRGVLPNAPSAPSHVLINPMVSAPKTTPVQEQLAEMKKVVVTLRQARDSVIAQCAMAREKLRHSQDRVGELEEERELLRLEKKESMEFLSLLQAECRRLREQLAVAEHSRAANPSDELIAKARALVAEAEERAGRIKESQKATVSTLVESFAKQQRKVAEALEDERMKAQIQINALKAQLAVHAQAAAAVPELERARVQIATLKAELNAVRDEVEASRQRPAVQTPAEQEGTLELIASITVEDSGEEASPEEVISMADFAAEMEAVDWYLQGLVDDPSQLEAVDVLASLFRDCSQRALSAQLPALHRIAASCGEMATWLRRAPGKMGTGLPLLREGRELIRTLLQTGAAATIEDPRGAQVYAVDNDADNCECISMALDKAELQTRYATKTEVAVAALEREPSDLIILDVDLGDSDGFALHDRIRRIDHHLRTPIIFVSGLLSTRERIAGLSGPAASFVAKPYNLNELVLKALCTIVASRLPNGI